MITNFGVCTICPTAPTSKRLTFKVPNAVLVQPSAGSSLSDRVLALAAAAGVYRLVNVGAGAPPVPRAGASDLPRWPFSRRHPLRATRRRTDPDARRPCAAAGCREVLTAPRGGQCPPWTTPVRSRSPRLGSSASFALSLLGPEHTEGLAIRGGELPQHPSFWEASRARNPLMVTSAPALMMFGL